MLSNHNRANSSFRIIEPKQQSPPQYQQAHQSSVNMLQQIPILSMNNPNSNMGLQVGFQQPNLFPTHHSLQFNKTSPFNNSTGGYFSSSRTSSQNNNHIQNNNNQNHFVQKSNNRARNLSDTDSSYIPETTSESGISDLDMSEKCTCCPYGYHIDTDFVGFLHDLGGPNKNVKQMKKIQRKRNDKIQRSMEYVIDEVEKLRQINGENDHLYVGDRAEYTSSPLNQNLNFSLNQSSNIYSHSVTPTNSIPVQHQPRQLVVPSVLKKTINKIDKLTNEELFTASLNSERARRILQERKTNMSVSGGSPIGIHHNNCILHNTKHHSSNNYLNLGTNNNSFPSTTSLPQQQRNIVNAVHNLQHQQKTKCTCNAQKTSKQQVPPRRSYSSCAEPLRHNIMTSSTNTDNNNNTVNRTHSSSYTRRCNSSRSSPIRQVAQPIQHQMVYQSNPKLQCNERCVRSRSHSRRTNNSRSPVQQLYRREIKINLTPKERGYEEEEINNLMEERIVTTTTKQPPKVHKSTASIMPMTPIQPEVQEEVLLNLFSCNNSGSVSSDSSESLVEFEDPKLKINEVYEKKVEERPQFTKPAQPSNNPLLEKRLAELELKLRRLPELEIKNNILAEEKAMLVKQLLSMKKEPAPEMPVEKPTKLFRSIGSNSNESEFKRDIGTECKAVTRDVCISVDEPHEEVQKMETIITTLRDQLNEQTLILEKALQKPQTRDVAIMHVVDKVEKPKPEVRDVAINHTTVIDNKELIEKHTIITNTYIKEIETLRLENAHLSAKLEELIKKHSKHVVTRGTHAPEQPVLYSVGTNTAKTQTRDVQVMYTPKSRDVSMATDHFSNTRDVALTCSLANIELEQQMMELMEIKAKYEEMLEDKLRNVKTQRDVATVCDLNHKEWRSVSLGCNLIEVKQMRDVSMKCNLDEEFRSFRDVCIECHLDTKLQKDANIMVNTIPAPPVTKDFSTNVQFEDQGKLELALELAMLKKSQQKVTRDIGVFVDQRSRLVEDQMRHQACGMEQVKTFNRQINTENVATKDFSVGTTFGDETHEFELKTYKKQLVEEEKHKQELFNVNTELKKKLQVLEEELRTEKHTIEYLNEKISAVPIKAEVQTRGINTLTNLTKNQACSNTDLSVLNEKIDMKIEQSNKRHSGEVKKTETEFEQHKFTRYDTKNKTRDQLVTMSFTATNKEGEKITESATYATKIPVTADNLGRAEMRIPIEQEGGVSCGFTDDVMILSEIAVAEQEAYKNIATKPKGILKSSITESSSRSKSLTFGENKIVCDSYPGGSELSLDQAEHDIDGQDVDIEYECGEDPYETPITTIENQTAEAEKHRSMKTEHPNVMQDYDDYELQEQMLDECHEPSKASRALRSANVDSSEQCDSSEAVQKLKQTVTSQKQTQSSASICVDNANNPTVPAYQCPLGCVPTESFELELELHIACAILNDSLYEPLKADKNKVARALNLIQQDWFKLSAKKDSNPQLVEEHLNAFYTRFSNLLLERIVNMADLILNTALHYSVSNGNFEIVNLLLDTKVCDVNAQNKAGGYTSIMLAALVPVTNDYERMTLKRLFSEGNVNIKSTDNGQTALMLAVMHGNKDTVSLLLVAGSDCNLQDKEGSTALMAACEHGHIEIVRSLLNNTNCDPDIKDNDGETAFDISKKKQRNDIIVLLYAHSSKLRSHHPAISKSRPKFNSSFK